MTQEELYDAEVAPKLAELANWCADHGMMYLLMILSKKKRGRKENT